MSYSILCPECKKYGGCICHRGQWLRRFFPFLFGNRMCGYEWESMI